VLVDRLSLSLVTSCRVQRSLGPRMARMEALVTDLRSGLRTLRSEKAMVDVAMEKAGDLICEVKEAEALIRALKDERKTSGRFL
jgi:hypothetical protein